MCLITTGIVCEHLPSSSASFPFLIQCFRHLSDPASSFSHRKARTFEHRSCHSLSSCTLGGNLGATRFIQSARSAQLPRVGLVMDISASGLQRRNLAIYRNDFLISINVKRISLNFLKTTGSAVLFISSSMPIVGGTIPPWATCGETLALLFSNSNQFLSRSGSSQAPSMDTRPCLRPSFRCFNIFWHRRSLRLHVSLCLLLHP